MPASGPSQRDAPVAGAGAGVGALAGAAELGAACAGAAAGAAGWTRCGTTLRCAPKLRPPPMRAASASDIAKPVSARAKNEMSAVDFMSSPPIDVSNMGAAS